MTSTKNVFKTVLAISLSTLLVTTSSAKDFTLDVLPQAENPTFFLPGMIGNTYYDVVYNVIAEAMEKEGSVRGGNNETKLKNGGGVSVLLTPDIYNIHINFPPKETGGRSYGWTSGKVGDWSDSMYLDNLAEVATKSSDKELSDFYKVIINMLGNSDTSQLDDLKPEAIRVATNYLAIHTAEQYRRIQKHTTRWDDALLQVTLLAAFHGGQEKFQMFYTGEFTDTVRKKDSGVYANGRKGVLFDQAKIEKANLESYHQFSGKTPDQEGANRSGINLTRRDFEKMGEELTRYFESTGSKHLEQIKKIIKYNPKQGNIIAAIAEYYCEGKALAEDTKAMSEALSAFMVENRKQANEISKVIFEKTNRNSCLKFYSH